jgi:uncharacterized membrane protein YdbT with pleckstrin-like domain
MSTKSFAGLYLGLGLLAGASVILAVLLDPGGYGFFLALLGILPLVCAFVGTWIVRASLEYRVFPDSIEVESGLIGRKIDSVQLFRVRDLSLKQSLLGRMLDVGEVQVVSTDATSPSLVLRGIEDPRAVYEKLRELVARSQATRRTLIVEEEQRGG